MARRTPFNLQEQLRLALTWILADMDKCFAESPDWDRGYHFSASDVESRVRSAAAEIIDGREYGFYQMHGSWGAGFRIGGLNGQTLLAHCRQFLSGRVRSGELRADQPSGKHVCSGLRFRPAKNPRWTKAELAKAAVPAEEAKRLKDDIVHYQAGLTDGDWKTPKAPECTKNNPPKKRSFSYGPRKIIRCSGLPHKVTCKRCLKLIPAVA